MQATTERRKDPSVTWLGEHRVVQEEARDETGETYTYYRCVDCGREQVNRESFTDEATGLNRCKGGR